MAKTKAVQGREGQPKMPHNILLKLFGFTILLFVLPVASFFVSKNYLFTKNAEIYAGIVGVVAANLVLLLYICLIFNEEELIKNSEKPKVKAKVDDAEEIETESEGNGESKKEGKLRKRK